MPLRLRQRVVRSAWLQAWLERRLPVVKTVVLNQRRIFIFLSLEGMLFSILLLVTFIAGINYSNNLILGFCFFLASILVVTIHHTYAQLSGLKLEGVDASDSEVDGVAQYRIRLSATGSRSHRQLLLEWGGQVQQLDQVLHEQIVSFQLTTPQRGRFIPPRLKVSSVYPLGILRAWSYVYFDLPTWVYPKPVACDLVGLGTQHAQDDEQSVERVAGQDEFDGLREFIAGESMARISWAHLARGQGLLSKHFSDPRGQQQVLDYHLLPMATHEMRLSYLAYWVLAMAQQQATFGLRLPQTELPMGAGTAHVQAALRLLAEHP